jgi:hypothetical protein
MTQGTTHTLSRDNSIGSNSDIPQETKDEVKNYVLKFEEQTFGITPLELKSTFYGVDPGNYLRHRPETEMKIAWKKGHSSFMKRDPELCHSRLL